MVPHSIAEREVCHNACCCISPLLRRLFHSAMKVTTNRITLCNAVGVGRVQFWKGPACLCVPIWVWHSLFLLLPIHLHTCDPSSHKASAVYIPWFYAPVSLRLFVCQCGPLTSASPTSRQQPCSKPAPLHY